MSSPARPTRTVTLTAASSTPSISAGDIQDDFLAFQSRPVIRDFKLSAELFASNGDIVLICGKGTQEKQGMLLVSYEIPSTTVSIASSIRLLKVIKLTKKSVTQLETVPIMKIALLLGDGIVTIIDIDSLAEITSISNSTITLFSTWYEMPSSSTTPGSPVVAPDKLRICVANKRNSLAFYHWYSQKKRIEENKDLRGGFELYDKPRAIAFSHNKIFIGYKKSYALMSLETGMQEKEFTFTKALEPMINCLQDRTKWCIQLDYETVFLDSDFEPMYKIGITWKDIPTAIVQSSPYVLALLPQSIDVCTFNGEECVPVQRIVQKGASATAKCRLWMDARSERIYAATPTDVVLLEPISAIIQLQNYIGMYRYDLAVTLIRGILSIVATTPPSYESVRTNEGNALGNLDTTSLPKVYAFDPNSSSDVVLTRQTSLLESSRQSSLSDSTRQAINDAALWNEYYRVGTMYAFQLFHKQNFKEACICFNNFITDPAEVVSLFAPLSPNEWLTKPYQDFQTFVKQHRHFSEPADFRGVTFENALHEFQTYLTEVRRIFQTVFRRSPDTFLEVQSLVQNRLLLRPVRELLIIVETALLKAYLIDNNNTLANALLRQDNCCLPNEVEKELIKNRRRNELVSFYEKQNRHKDALELLTRTESLSSDENILDYLTKLNNENLQLIFKYTEPMLKKAFEGKGDDNLLHDILILFTGEPTPTSPSAGLDTSGTKTIKLDPVEVFEFLKKFNEDFAIKFFETICLKPELGSKQREIHNRLVFAYCDRLKTLSNQLKQAIQMKNPTQDTFQDNDMMATNTSLDKNKFSNLTLIKKQRIDYESKLKYFLLNNNCKCDFDKLQAYFLHEQNNSLNERLFSLHYGIILGKLGKHEEALDVFLKNGFFIDAEQYCETIYLTGKISLARELYRQLIDYLLKQTNNETINENSLKEILRIINNATERLDPVQILEILPGQFKLNTMTDFIQHSIQTCSTSKRSSQLERNLLFMKLLRSQLNRITSENHSFIIDSDTRCARNECRQPFSALQAVVRFPNDKIVHLHCRTKYENELEKLQKKRY